MRAFGLSPSAWDNIAEDERVIMMAYEQHRFETLADQLERMVAKEVNTPEAVATLFTEMV